MIVDLFGLKLYIYEHDELLDAINYINDNEKKNKIEYPGAFYRLKTALSKTIGMPDYFIVPMTFVVISDQDNFNDIFVNFCKRLKFWEKWSYKHVFHIGGVPKPTNSSAIIIQTSCTKEDKAIAAPYWVKDPNDYKNISLCEYHCAFQGCLNTHPVRLKIPEVLKNISKSYFKENSDYFNFLSNDEQLYLFEEWYKVLNNSKYILCPRGFAVNSIRFFETMAFGRIPVLISDDAKLPLEKYINYDKFIVRVPEEEILNTSNYINEFENKYSIEEASKECHDIWDKYFASDKGSEFLKMALPRKVFL